MSRYNLRASTVAQRRARVVVEPVTVVERSLQRISNRIIVEFAVTPTSSNWLLEEFFPSIERLLAEEIRRVRYRERGRRLPRIQNRYLRLTLSGSDGSRWYFKSASIEGPNQSLLDAVYQFGMRVSTSDPSNSLFGTIMIRELTVGYILQE